MIYQHITAVSTNVYIDYPGEIVERYSNTYHTTIKIKLTDLKANTYTGVCVKKNDKDPKLKDMFNTSLKISKLKKLLGRFTRRSCQRPIKESLGLKRY